jgi:putative PIN family toxin of toxin-antitoxin system
VRIVLDTNVLVSALITKGTPPDLLYQAWDAGSFELVTSEAQLSELARVLEYEKLRPYIHREEVEALLEAMSAVADVVEALPDIDLSKDPDDDAILATAIAGEADLLVTGDKSHLLELKTVRGIPIVTPRQALRRVGRPSHGSS